MNRVSLVVVISIAAVVFSENNKTNVEYIRVLNITENSVLFYINLLNSSGQEKISVKYQESLEKDGRQILWNAGEKYKIKNLIPSGRYDFQFKVEPSGDWSDKQEVVLLPDVPEVIFRSFNDGVLNLHFFRTSADAKRKTIDKYRIVYNKIRVDPGSKWGTDGCEILIEVPVCKGPTYDIAGFSYMSYYEIRVQAHTESGYGRQYSHRVSYRKMD